MKCCKACRCSVVLTILSDCATIAYIAISLDTTGLLRFLAFHVAIRGGSSGPRLFYFLYAFFFLLGLLVGNDAVVLSGTSFLAHFTRIAGLARPDAWIWAQFAAANIASATLVSSNLTNVVIANGFGLKFTIFSAFMALPTVASGLGAVLAIRLVFINRRAEATCKPRWLARVVRKISRSSNKVAASEVDSRQMAGVVTLAEASAGPSELTRRGSIAPSVASGTKAIAAAEALGEEHDEDKDANASSSNSPQRALSQQVVFIPPFLVAPDVQPRAVLIDPFGAIFGSVVMAITLVVLIATSVVGGVKVYQVAVPAAFVCLLKDLWKDLSDSQRHRLQKGKESDREAKSRAQGNANVVVELGELSNKSGMNAKDIAVSKTLDGIDNARPGPSTSSIDPLFGVLSIPGKIASVIPTVSHVATRLPLPLVPFAFGMFILDESLAHVGFIHIMACWMGKACASGGEIGSAFFIGFLCVFLCCFGGTNIGASILLVRSIQDAGFQSTLPLAQRDSITQIALYSLALGSNVGALGGIFAASLAGLLWRGCLRHGGITVQPGQFFVWSLLTMPLSLSAGLVVVWAQVKSGKWPM